ncbi:hypothetical protein [Shewanella putrefaciens]|uniref:hypothetical protein n=1 Tax=Shewanella putrefaciens TaxID=24 RepID=UPI0018E79A39|nr:hypothetical protein [Shewanella putrefaciens]
MVIRRHQFEYAIPLAQAIQQQAEQKTYQYLARASQHTKSKKSESHTVATMDGSG